MSDTIDKVQKHLDRLDAHPDEFGFMWDQSEMLREATIQIYENLVADQKRGIIEVKGMSAYEGSCRVCQTEVSKQIYLLADLIAAYEEDNPTVPILPHAKCIQVTDHEGVCRCCWQGITPRQDNVSDEFADWLEAELAKS